MKMKTLCRSKTRARAYIRSSAPSPFLLRSFVYPAVRIYSTHSFLVFLIRLRARKMTGNLREKEHVL